MKVAKYIFHLSFQLAGAKLFLSGNFRREGRKAASISVCKQVPCAAEVSLRSGWFGKPNIVLPAGEVQRVGLEFRPCSSCWSTNISVLHSVHQAFFYRYKRLAQPKGSVWSTPRTQQGERKTRCFALPFQRGIIIALDCDKGWVCADVTSSGCGPSHPRCGGVYSGALRRQSIRWMENNVLESCIQGCFITWYFQGAYSQLLV